MTRHLRLQGYHPGTPSSSFLLLLFSSLPLFLSPSNPLNSVLYSPKMHRHSIKSTFPGTHSRTTPPTLRLTTTAGYITYRSAMYPRSWWRNSPVDGQPDWHWEAETGSRNIPGSTSDTGTNRNGRGNSWAGFFLGL